MARASVRQRESIFSGAEKDYRRQSTLIHRDATSHQIHENAETAYKNAQANLAYARANEETAAGRSRNRKRNWPEWKRISGIVC